MQETIQGDIAELKIKQRAIEQGMEPAFHVRIGHPSIRLTVRSIIRTSNRLFNRLFVEQVLVDDIDNTFNKVLAPWPQGVYVLRMGKLIYRSDDSEGDSAS